MASLINNNRFNIWFSNKPNASGVYRYDVSIDSALVFVGNAYLEANENPIIDVTDIIKNYVDVNKPPFSTIAEKSSVYKTVDVKIYINNTSYTQSSDIFMIYENPQYNSNVSTTILDTFATQNIYTMPMLQGWDYGANEGYLLPTYPAMPSNNFTFDMVCGYQSMPIVNSFVINYTNGLTNEPTFVNIDGNGVYQYSIPMSTLLTSVSEDNTITTPVSDYFQPSLKGWTVTRDDDVLTLQSSVNTAFDEATIIYTSRGLGFVEPIENTRTGSDFTGITSLTFAPNDMPTSIRVELRNSGIRVDMVTFTVNNLPTGTTSVEVTFIVDRSVTSSYRNEIVLQTTIDYTKVATICDASSMDITTFSPINSNQRYTYTIAKFDNQSRYFLKWKDRYGMPQVQPFGGTYKYSESISKNTMTDYKNTKKIIDISNTPKWLLNSRWIKQEYYPFYESIFVSPYLQLYDAKEDKVYNVILTNTEYDEKTFNNQNRQLFNIQLEVELDTTETMIY